MSVLEKHAAFIEALEDYLVEVRDQRKTMQLVDQSVSRLGSLNADIARQEEKLADLKNQIQVLLAKLHLRQEAA